MCNSLKNKRLSNFDTLSNYMTHMLVTNNVIVTSLHVVFSILYGQLF